MAKAVSMVNWQKFKYFESNYLALLSDKKANKMPINRGIGQNLYYCYGALAMIIIMVIVQIFKNSPVMGWGGLS